MSVWIRISVVALIVACYAPELVAGAPAGTDGQSVAAWNPALSNIATLSLITLGFVVVVPPIFGRKWTDNTGKYSVEAEFVGLRGDKVHLKKRDGKVIGVLLGRLSKVDQQYVRTHVAAESAVVPPCEIKEAPANGPAPGR